MARQKTPRGYNVFPAHAGMDRLENEANPGIPCVPRPRGDGPAVGDIIDNVHTCSPPTRGWTDREITRRLVATVFPAHAGMDRILYQDSAGAIGVPRPRGDGPWHFVHATEHEQCSPPTRGWTALDRRVGSLERVFPAHAGMDRSRLASGSVDSCVPRPRGDGPDCRECGVATG